MPCRSLQYPLLPAAKGKVSHGSLLNENYAPTRVTSGWKSTAVGYDRRRYKRRNRIEIMFGRLKDWRRIATRYDRCAKTFLSAVALAATVMFWL